MSWAATDNEPQVFAIIQSSIVLSGCSHGLGKAFRLIPSEMQTRVQEVRPFAYIPGTDVLSLTLLQKLYYTSNLFFVLALGLSKLSLLCFLLRLTPARRHKIAFWAAAGFVGAWTFASVLAVALQCNTSHPWILVGETCSGSVRPLPITTKFRDKIWLRK